MFTKVSADALHCDWSAFLQVHESCPVIGRTIYGTLTWFPGQQSGEFVVGKPEMSLVNKEFESLWRMATFAVRVPWQTEWRVTCESEAWLGTRPCDLPVCYTTNPQLFFHEFKKKETSSQSCAYDRAFRQEIIFVSPPQVPNKIFRSC